MKVSLGIKKNGAYEWHNVSNTFTMDERLDEELDGGACEIMTSTEDELANFTLVMMKLEDGTTTRYVPFFAFDDVEKRAKDYYKHTVELIEPTRWLMGLTVDGLKVTQPIGTATKKTLYDVLVRVLKCYNTKQADKAGQLIFTIDEGTKTVLEAVTSPEFEWSAGTLLYEVLQDIADVVNCMPRLTASTVATQERLVLVFDKVNDIAAEFEI